MGGQDSWGWTGLLGVDMPRQDFPCETRQRQENCQRVVHSLFFLEHTGFGVKRRVLDPHVSLDDPNIEHLPPDACALERPSLGSRHIGGEGFIARASSLRAEP